MTSLISVRTVPGTLSRISCETRSGGGGGEDGLQTSKGKQIGRQVPGKPIGVAG